MSHTPGPWIQWADTNIIIRLHSGSKRSEDLRICEVATNTWQDQGRYNARLIAAAPDLLEALRWIERRCPAQLLLQDLHRIHMEAAHDAGACARAAIAKAEPK